MTTPHRNLLQQALDALEVATTPLAKDRQEVLRAIAALREALAAPEPEPVAHLVRFRTARTAAAMTRDNSGPYTDWGPWCAMMPHEVQMQKGTTLPDCMQTMPLYAAPPAAPAPAAPVVREPLRDDAFHAWVEEASADHPNLLERQEFRDAMYNAWINGYNTRVDEQAHGITGASK